MDVPSTADRSPLVAAGRWLLRQFNGAGFDDEATLQDLAVIRRPVEVQAGFTVAGAAVGALAGPMIWSIIAVTGTRPPALVPVWLTLMGARVGLRCRSAPTSGSRAGRSR